MPEDTPEFVRASIEQGYRLGVAELARRQAQARDARRALDVEGRQPVVLVPASEVWDEPDLTYLVHGMIPDTGTPPDALARFIDSEIARWGKVVQQAGLAGTE